MNIYLADDHQIVRDGLKLLLKQAYRDAAIFEAGSFNELLSIVSEDNHEDLILCDLCMPDMEGVKGIQMIREAFPKVLLIVLSGSFSQENIAQAMAIGVNGFVAKNSAGASLINIIRLVQAGETYLPTEWLRTVVEPIQKEQQPKNSVKGLTLRETEVLRQLALGHPNKVIARTLAIEESTIKSHIKSIYEKLGVSNRTQAATKAIELKLVINTRHY